VDNRDLGERLEDLTVALPPGRIVEIDGEPAFWLTDDQAPPGLWSLLRAHHDISGLWPVLVVDDEPWWTQAFSPSVDHIDDHDAEEFMSDVWNDWEDDDRSDPGLREPFGEWCPGLAAAGEPTMDPDGLSERYAAALEPTAPRLALVPVDRSADALAAMGWEGAAHHADTAALSAMLRSWEERFGVRVVKTGRNTLVLSVAAPPVVDEHAVQVAAEHWVFCPMAVQRQDATLETYAHDIEGKNSWVFRWV
jgi:hypothetical protein